MTQATVFTGILSVVEPAPGRWFLNYNRSTYKPFQNWNNVLSYLARSQSVNRERTQFILIALGAGAHEVRKPIKVWLDHISSDEVIATFPAARIAISGSNATEAIQLLKTEISETFGILKNEKKLGPVPQRQLRILGEHLGKKGRKQASTA